MLRRCLTVLLCRSPALSVSYSPDASLIAVGLAGGGVSVVKPSEEDVTTLQLEKVADFLFVGETAGICSEENITSSEFLEDFASRNVLIEIAVATSVFTERPGLLAAILFFLVVVSTTSTPRFSSFTRNRCAAS